MSREEYAGRPGIKGTIRKNKKGKDTVYLNIDLVTEDTPFHEYIHPFIELVYQEHLKAKQSNPFAETLFEQLEKEITDEDNVLSKQTLDRIQADPVYSKYERVNQIKEAIVDLAGRYARGHFEDRKEIGKVLANEPTPEFSAPSSFRRALQRLWTRISTEVRNMLGKFDKDGNKIVVKPEEIKKMTIEEIGLLFGYGESDIDYSKYSDLLPLIEYQTVTKTAIDEIKEESDKFNIAVDENGTEAEEYTNSSLPGTTFGRITNFIKHFIMREVKNIDDDFIEQKAKDAWGMTPITDKMFTDLNQKRALSFEEYKVELKRIYEAGRVKGKIIHRYLQSFVDPENKEAYEQEINQLMDEYGILEHTVIWAKNKAKEILSVHGISKGDKIRSEVTVGSKILGIAGTIDMLVEHPDGTFTIIDWKSGWSFDRHHFTTLLLHGEQNIDITDNQRERAKLQIALYAVLPNSGESEQRY